MYRRSTICSALLLSISILLTGCGHTYGNASVAMPAHISQVHSSLSPLTTNDRILPEAEHVEEKIFISFTGDIMVHYPQLLRAYDHETESFDFSGSLRYVAPVLQSADYVIGNLETTLGPTGSARVSNEETAFMGYSGFPCFNTPSILGENLAEAGFDFLVTANNHSLDTKEDGLLNTLTVLDEAGLGHTGTFHGERKAYETIEVKGAKLAIVSYTYGINGFSVDADSAEWINTLEMYDETAIETLLDDVGEAKASGADRVIVFLHWGNEYKTEADRYYQMPLAESILDAGADVIIGSHPHVLQPIAFEGEDAEGFIAYSLGNFLSSQTHTDNYNGAPTDMGAVLTLVFESVDGTIQDLEGFYILPTLTVRRKDGVYILPAYSELAVTSYESSRLSMAADWVPTHMTGSANGTLDENPMFGLYYKSTR